ncbi:MAG TPA: 3'(2'),5'-bisphosphate nucleotidase CysQ [Deltaproteobacteria bacterium]|nr:3'(2'),5'-bisphosphate nucleotidase CysQ [Deltaproteobacteria bacterium]
MRQPGGEFIHELEVALAAASEAGAILLRQFAGPTESWEKSEDNPVTPADLESDRAIRARLRRAFPEDGLLSEETVSDASRHTRRRAWIVDPMDGTKEFVARIPEFAVSIALAEAGEPVVGVVLNPAAGVAVLASRGTGAWRGSWAGGEIGPLTRVAVSQCSRLSEAIVVASRTEISRGQLEPYAPWFREVRPVGSIAWKLASVASGCGDLNVSFVPKNEWDVCAGDLLVREAGGVYLSFAGARRTYNQPDPCIDEAMVAGSPALVEAFCRKVRG